MHSITTVALPEGNEKPSATPNGEDFVFASRGVAGEPRGGGYNGAFEGRD